MYVFGIFKGRYKFNLGELVFSALRVYALWDRNIAFASLVLALNLVPVAVNIVSLCSRCLSVLLIAEISTASAPHQWFMTHPEFVASQTQLPRRPDYSMYTVGFIYSF